eukprot:g8481.t1
MRPPSPANEAGGQVSNGGAAVAALSPRESRESPASSESRRSAPFDFYQYFLSPYSSLRYLLSVSIGSVVFAFINFFGVMYLIGRHWEEEGGITFLNFVGFLWRSDYKVLGWWLLLIFSIQILQFFHRIKMMFVLSNSLHVLNPSPRDEEEVYASRLRNIMYDPYMRFLKNIGTPMMVFHLAGFILFVALGVSHWKTFQLDDIHLFHLGSGGGARNILGNEMHGAVMPTGLLPQEVDAMETSTYFEFVAAMNDAMNTRGCHNNPEASDTQKLRSEKMGKGRIPANCSICLEPYKLKSNVTMLHCSPMHIFHSSCVRRWFLQSDKCPLCNTRLGTSPTPRRTPNTPVS